jgi:hypothetical protein
MVFFLLHLANWKRVADGRQKPDVAEKHVR